MSRKGNSHFCLSCLLMVLAFMLIGCSARSSNIRPAEQVPPYTMESKDLFEEARNALTSGKFGEAKRIYERLLDESTQAQDNNGISASLMGLGFVHLVSREYSEAYASFSRALTFVNDDNRRVCEGFLSYADGMIKQKAGLHDEAVRALDNALKIAEEKRANEEEIFIYIALADSHFAKSEFDATISCHFAVIQKIKELGTKGWEPTEAATLFKLGQINRLLSRYEESIEYFRKSASSYRRLALWSEGATALTQAGEILFWLGDPRGAAEEYKKALGFCRKDPNKKNILIQADVLSALAEMSLLSGAPPQIVEEYSNESKAIMEPLLPMSSDGITTIYKEYSKVFMSIMKSGMELPTTLTDKNPFVSFDNYYYHQFIELVNKSSVMNNKIKGLFPNITEHVVMVAANIYQRLGRCYLYKGKPMLASGALMLAATLHTCIPFSLHTCIELAKDWYYLGVAYRKAGHYEIALPCFDAVKQAAYFLRTPEIHWVFSALGSTYADMGRKDQAITYYRKGFDILDFVRGQQNLDEMKISVIESSIYVYRKYISLLLDLYRERGTEQFLNDSFEQHQRIKARIFSDMMSNSKHTLSPEEVKLRSNIAQIYSKLQTVKDPTEEDSLLQRLDSVRDQWRNTQDQTKSFPGSVSHSPPIVASIKQVQAILDADSAFFEYFACPEKSAFWVITKDQVRVFFVPGIEALPVLESFLATLRHPLTGKREIENHIILGKKIYDGLIRPAEQLLIGKKHLIIAPDGPLHYLPFETLIEDTGHNGTADVNNVDYLINRFQISYVPSASVFVSMRSEGNKKKHIGQIPLLAFGDPILDGAGVLKDQIGPLLRDMHLKRLKFSSEEIGRIAQVFGIDHHSSYLNLKGNATVRHFKALDLSRYRIIHFATHAVLGDEVKRATQPAIVLSPEGTDSPYSLLTFSDIIGLKFNAELVTLSACNTGLGKMHEGEGIVGLTRAFLYSGADSVLVSLWSVEDQSTSILMEDFYSFIAKGETKGEALRHAKQKAMKSTVQLEATGTRRSLASPFFWAPFVLVGDSN